MAICTARWVVTYNRKDKAVAAFQITAEDMRKYAYLNRGPLLCVRVTAGTLTQEVKICCPEASIGVGERTE